MRCFWMGLLLLFGQLSQAQLSEQQFRRPDAAHAPRVRWLWVNGNVNREGINLDLEALSGAGMSGGVLYCLNEGDSTGKVRFNTPEWTELMLHALQQAERLGLTFSLYPSEGRSVLSGPWIRPENASQVLVWSEITLHGGQPIRTALPKPSPHKGSYKDIAVLAYAGDAPKVAATVLDLTNLLDANEQLAWNAPKGNWTVVRIGYTPDATQGHLYADLLSRNGVQQQIDHFLKPLLEQTKPFHGRTLIGLTIDSCTVSPRQWTAALPAEFLRRKGYDLKPYLLALTGITCRTAKETRQFLWDFRNVQNQLMEEDYVGGLRALASQYGLRLTPALSDAVEFEHLPYPAPKPALRGVSNREAPMFSQSADFFEYQRRCRYVRQAALIVADAACCLGEADAGSSPAMPGMIFDTLGVEALLSQATMAGGRLVFPDGRSYRMLVLPEVRSLSLPLVRTLKSLLEGGLWLSALKPAEAPGILLAKESGEWQALVDELWGKLPDGVYRYGAGRLFINQPAARLSEALRWTPDFFCTPSRPDADLSAQHLRVGSDEVWALSNNRERADTLLAGFHITGKQPEWWNPLTGEVHPIDLFRQHDEHSLVPMMLEPLQTVFVVFRKPWNKFAYDGLTKDGFLLLSADPDVFPDRLAAGILPDEPDAQASRGLPLFLTMNGERLFHAKGSYALVTPKADPKEQPSLLLKKTLPMVELRYGWTVSFIDSSGIENAIEVDSLPFLGERSNPRLTSFSGTVSWKCRFNLLPKDLPGNRFVLDLGSVGGTAEVYVNGKSAGPCWRAPYRLDVTNLLKPGENHLEIQRTQKMGHNTDSELFGPVTLSAWRAMKE